MFGVPDHRRVSLLLIINRRRLLTLMLVVNRIVDVFWTRGLPERTHRPVTDRPCRREKEMPRLLPACHNLSPHHERRIHEFRQRKNLEQARRRRWLRVRRQRLLIASAARG